MAQRRRHRETQKVTTQKPQQKPAPSRRPASPAMRYLALALGLVVAVGIGFLLSKLAPGDMTPPQGGGASQSGGSPLGSISDIDPGAVEGRIPNGDVEIEGDPTGQHFFYQVNLTPVFPTGGEAGTVGAENPPGNLYNMRISYVLEGENAPVYQSGVIPPGYYIAGGKLNRTLANGGYAGIAFIEAIDPASGEVVDSFVETIFVQVGPK